MIEKSANLKNSLKKLNAIVAWFESQDEIDVEAGLEKVTEGATLVKICKKRLSEIENEFEKIQRDVESEGKSSKGSTKDAESDDVPF